jgi:hypothetical protein
VLLDRTVALVRSGAMTETEGRSVSKALRAAIDSRPLALAVRRRRELIALNLPDLPVAVLAR